MALWVLLVPWGEERTRSRALLASVAAANRFPQPNANEPTAKPQHNAGAFAQFEIRKAPEKPNASSQCTLGTRKKAHSCGSVHFDCRSSAPAACRRAELSARPIGPFVLSAACAWAERCGGTPAAARAQS